MRWGAWLVLLAVAAGCTAPATLPPESVEPATTDDVLPTTFPVVCRLLDEMGAPIPRGACEFSSEALTRSREVDASGRAVYDWPAGESLTLTGRATGRFEKHIELLADGPKQVDLVLVARSSNGTTAQPDLPSGGNVTPSAPVAPRRAWTAPVEVPTRGDEPHVAVALSGTIYYAPTTTLHRSRDGGITWADISPPATVALPTFASDTSVSVAPDGAVWWSRYWGYAGGTIACRSLDEGTTWSCNNAALPGATDRMWIVGLSSSEAYVQTNEGLYENVWAHTTDGGVTFIPHSRGGADVRNGNMVYDPLTGAVHQAFGGSRLAVARIDTASMSMVKRATGLSPPGGLPGIAAQDGAVWIVGGQAGALAVGRSMDDGISWTEFVVPVSARASQFATIAAGPGGRVAVAFYGSDSPGSPDTNQGTWSIHVVRTDDAFSPRPTWVETRVVPDVHQGPICLGAACEQTTGAPRARFAGDLMGVALDADGNAHVAYNSDADGTVRSMFVREVTQ